MKKSGAGDRRARRYGVLAGLLLCLMGLALPVLARPSMTVWTGTVTYVSDGDTLWVRPERGGAPRSVRVDGIDAPELCQTHGEAARAALVGQVLGQTVQVRVRQHDDFGRALAHVSIHKRDVAGWLVSQGHAWSYRYRGRTGPYTAQESQARAHHLGLFQQAHPELPREFRRRHGPCH